MLIVNEDFALEDWNAMRLSTPDGEYTSKPRGRPARSGHGLRDRGPPWGCDARGTPRLRRAT